MLNWPWNLDSIFLVKSWIKSNISSLRLVVRLSFELYQICVMPLHNLWECWDCFYFRKRRKRQINFPVYGWFCFVTWEKLAHVQGAKNQIMCPAFRSFAICLKCSIVEPKHEKQQESARPSVSSTTNATLSRKSLSSDNFHFLSPLRNLFVFTCRARAFTN